jgi:RNA polymerase sigma factor (sigma-70 family)
MSGWLQQGRLVSGVLGDGWFNQAWCVMSHIHPNERGAAEGQPDSDERLARPLSACLAGLAAGDPSARDRIIEVCSERLRVLAHRMLGRFPNVRRWNDTDDVFQNAAIRLHRTLGQITPASPADLLALAATHLHRELIDLARHHAGPLSYAANHGTNVIRRADGAADPVQVVDEAGATDAAAELERWSEFHAAIDALPPEHREVFHLTWYLGADQKTIAGLLGCSERTVKSRWRAAREAVRVALAGEPPQDA